MIGKLIRIFAFGALIALAACDEEAPVTMSGEARHPNGLVVPHPEDFGGGGPDGEHLIFAETGDVRQPLLVDFTIGTEAPPETATTGDLDGNTVHFLIEEGGAYSGGTEYKLRAWRPVEQRWIMMTAEQQNEGLPPSFAVAWEMMKGARIEN